jgi:hypothetical protein
MTEDKMRQETVITRRRRVTALAGHRVVTAKKPCNASSIKLQALSQLFCIHVGYVGLNDLEWIGREGRKSKENTVAYLQTRYQRQDGHHNGWDSNW